MLNKEQIKTLINEKKLIEHFIELETQLTPNGFDLTAGTISEFLSRGCSTLLTCSNSLTENRSVAVSHKEDFESNGYGVGPFTSPFRSISPVRSGGYSEVDASPVTMAA